jgi:hypothetical protein
LLSLHNKQNIKRTWYDKNQEEKREKKRNDLREIKVKFKVFERCCIDTKYLCDIPVY